MIHKNKGFTLIEMLVVIAVVGILSATVLTALGPARNKGRDARIISGINQIAAFAELEFTGNTFPVWGTTDWGVATEAVADIKKFNGNIDPTYNRTGDGSGFAVSSPLASGDFYCRDSAGKTGNLAALNGVCP